MEAMKHTETQQRWATHRYKFAAKARETELDLFWRRALFFWGFIGAAFVAFATLPNARNSVW